MQKGDIVIVSFLVILVVGLGWLFFAADTAPSIEDLGYTPVEVEGAQLLEAYVASDEAMNVVVDVPVATFVTVHAAMGDAPGPIVGQSGYLEPGKHMTSMRILPLMQTGETYIVLVHKDDGDGAYVTENDFPVMVDGEVLRADVVVPAL